MCCAVYGECVRIECAFFPAVKPFVFFSVFHYFSVPLLRAEVRSACRGPGCAVRLVANECEFHV